MKNTFLTLVLLCFLTGCNDQKLTHQETVTTYYNARNTGSYKVLKTVLNDRITITAGDFVMPYDHDSFYVQYKWDSVFKSNYEIIEFEEENEQIMVTVAQSNLRNAFLKNNPLVCKVKISFAEGKISKLEDLECVDADMQIWQSERDSLVSYITKNHTELDGFINDMTMNGAQKYLKAIALYEKK